MAWEKALAVCSRAAASTRLREQRRGKGQEQTFSDVPGGAVGRNPPAEAGARARSAVREDPTRPEPATEVRVSPLPKPVRPEPGLCNQTRRQDEKPGSRSRVVPARHGHGPGNEDPVRPKTINKSQKKGAGVQDTGRVVDEEGRAARTLHEGQRGVCVPSIRAQDPPKGPNPTKLCLSLRDEPQVCRMSTLIKRYVLWASSEEDLK